VSQAIQAFPEEELERGNRREDIAQDKKIDRSVSPLATMPGAKSVLEGRLTRIVCTRTGCVHTRAQSPSGVPDREYAKNRASPTKSDAASLQDCSSIPNSVDRAQRFTWSFESYCVASIPFTL
jgi:hypothetical protein